MTVPVQTPLTSSVANGVTTVFPYQFKLTHDTDLVVSVAGVVKTITTDYTVDGVGSDTGGNVTFVAAPANGANVILRRVMAFKRDTNYPNLGDLLAATLNADQDDPVMMLQQVAAGQMQLVEVGAGELVWDAAGLRIVNVALPGGSTGGGGDMYTSVYDPDGVAGQVVGLLAAQALKNKDLTDPSNTLPAATSATKLQTARKLNGVAFDGTADVAIPSQLVGINDQVSTSYTLVLGDNGKDVRCTNAAAITLIVPPNATAAFPVGTMIAFSQGGAGAVTATAGSGVTVRAANGAATTALYDARVLEKTDTDTWRVW